MSIRQLESSRIVVEFLTVLVKEMPSLGYVALIALLLFKGRARIVFVRVIVTDLTGVFIETCPMVYSFYLRGRGFGFLGIGQMAIITIERNMFSVNRIAGLDAMIEIAGFFPA